MLMLYVRLFALALGVAFLLCALPLMAELLIFSLAAALPPRRPRIGDAAGRDVRLAVVIPAHNEEKLIGVCVNSVRQSSGANVQIYVVAHNCKDATAEQAQGAGAQVLVLRDEVGGKGTALHFGFQQALAAGAQAVLVIDADSVVSPNLTSAVCSRIAAGADALQCRYEVSNSGASARTRLAALAFLGMNVLRPRGRDRLGLSCGIFGNGFALSAATLARVPYGANSLVEDLEYHLLLIQAGLRVRSVNEAAVYGEMPDGSAASATQRARWEGGRMLMRRQWTGRLLIQVLRGRFRMVEPLLDLLSVPLATGAVLLVLALGLALLGRSSPLALLAGAGLLVPVLYVLVSASLSASPGETLKALAAAPGYVVWKVMMIPRTRLAARKDAAWVRTERNDSL